MASYVVFHETEFSFVRLKPDWTFDITSNRKKFTSGSWYSLMSGFCTGFRFETTTNEVAQAGLKVMFLLPWEELRSQVHTTISGCGFLFSSFRLCSWVRRHLSGTLSHLSIHLFLNQSHIYANIDFWLFILFLRLEPNTIVLMAHIKQLHSLKDLFFSTRVCVCEESATQFFPSLFGVDGRILLTGFYLLILSFIMFFSTLLVLDTLSYSRLVLHFPYCGPRISHRAKSPWLLPLERSV